MTLNEYISEIQKQYATGVAREHSYRPPLQQLLASMLPKLTVTNEPARIKCGAPDYILTKGNTPVAFIEAKDIDDSDLNGRKQHKEQFERYKKSLDTLVITDYLDFHLYENGEFVDSVRIGEVKGDKIIPVKDNSDKFIQLIIRFGNARPQRITSAAQLAQHMASKARLLADVIDNALTDEDNTSENQTLQGQMNAFQQVLIHDITPKQFADIYAQTIAYGMFAARLHDNTPDDFSRMEAATLIPKTNPFLRQIFQNIAGFDLDERISWIVDDLAETFRATDMQKVMVNFGQRTRQDDPMIHFYEDFLKAYDPALRKSRGVYYTPQPIVNFIVRAVDEILQTEFGLPMGLADTSKIRVERNVEQSRDKRYADNQKKEMREYHKVQILDPATGTGTFLAETVKQIYEKFRGQGGMWQGYVEEHLLPRLNGFELMMAPYTMAHLKLDYILTNTGYKAIKNERLRIYLTNALEEVHRDTGTLFAQWLANEANEANRIKRDTPVMVVLGNPPYSASSNNKGEWIESLLKDYKKDLNERKINIDDDYIKFIRLGQYYVDKNNEGILAYISNNSFIDGVTHRRMRNNLLFSFDKIYILDLHGNSKKKEIAPDGSKDENVFDIQQGVSINIFVKTGKKEKGQLGEVFHSDLYGKRKTKYDYLSSSFEDIKWNKVIYQPPFFFFINKDYTTFKEYNLGFSLDVLFKEYNSGIQTKNDSLTIKFTEQGIKEVIETFQKSPKEDIIAKLNLKDSAGWNIQKAINDIKNNTGQYININYRLFDTRKTYFTGKSSGFIGRTRGRVMKDMLQDNIGLVFKRTGRIYGKDYDFFFISKNIISEGLFAIDPLGREYLAPLYLYPEDTQTSLDGNSGRKPNLDPKIVEQIEKKLNHAFIEEKNIVVDLAAGCDGTFAPIDLLDYIYAVLHSPTYREKYKEFLKTDFPRIPYPTDAGKFWQLVELGGELRRYHLLEHPGVNKLITTYPIAGNSEVNKIIYEADDNTKGRVWINDTQYFDNVPLVAWEFYIGGYQPAQKWLKDRKDRMLTFDDIMHYQRMITSLVNTDRIMKKIDNVKL